MKLHDVLNELFENHCHQKLWICPGCSADKIDNLALFPEKWPAPVILSQDYCIVAERLAESDMWALTSNLKNPKNLYTVTEPSAAFEVDSFYRFLFTNII